MPSAAAAVLLLCRARGPVRQSRCLATPAEQMARKSLKDFGYAFNSDGSLRRIDAAGLPGDQPFQFNVSDNHQECQQHYEELGETITEHVYQLLEKNEKLIKLPVPEGFDEDKGTFVFVSRDYERKNKLLILIHGSGVVRAGQWARSLIINDNLYTGSQIPYIRKGMKNDFGILLMNTNDNYRTIQNKPTKIPNSGNPSEHVYYVWEKYVRPTKAASIAIVAHSYGGVNTVELANKYELDFEKRVKAVAFTDSVHGFLNSPVPKHLKQIGKNWVASSDPIDHQMQTPDYDIARVSAGHSKHEMTSHSAMESVFKFITEKMLK